MKATQCVIGSASKDTCVCGWNLANIFRLQSSCSAFKFKIYYRILFEDFETMLRIDVGIMNKDILSPFWINNKAVAFFR